MSAIDALAPQNADNDVFIVGNQTSQASRQLEWSHLRYRRVPFRMTVKG